MRLAPFLLLAAAVTACGRTEPPPEPAPSALEKATRGLSAMGACANLIPQEWSPSRPVPSKQGGVLHYRAFFYGREGDPAKGFAFHSPQGQAAFTTDGRVLDCRRLPGEPLVIPPNTRLAGMKLDEIVARSTRLHAATEAVAALYASGRDIGETGRAKVADFARDFSFQANPAHAAAYRALDPDFWAWVEKNGGVAPAK